MLKRDLRKALIYLKALILVLAGVVILSSPALGQEGLRKIADNVYSYVDVKNGSPVNSFGANAGIIIGKSEILVIDTLTSAKEARRLIKDIRAIFPKPIRYVVNTHYHLDHSFGNSEFAKLGATIITHQLCQQNMKNHSEVALKNAKIYGLDEKDLEGTEIVYPGLTFTEKMEIDLGNQKINLIYPGPSHTDGSILVYLTDKKILFSGDILFTNYHPFMAEGNIEGWVKTLDYIMTLEVDTIIPGHGPLSTKKDIAEMKKYIIAFDQKAKELCAKSNDVKYISNEIMRTLPPRAEGDWLIPANISMKYLKK